MKIKHLLENEKFDYGIETFISSFEPFSMVTREKTGYKPVFS